MQTLWTGRTDLHNGALSYRFKTFQDLNFTCIVVVVLVNRRCVDVNFVVVIQIITAFQIYLIYLIKLSKTKIKKAFRPPFLERVARGQGGEKPLRGQGRGALVAPRRERNPQRKQAQDGMKNSPVDCFSVGDPRRGSPDGRLRVHPCTQ